MPRSDSQRRIVIACCQDFSSLLDTATLCANFQKLYDMWTPDKYHIEIRRFSFKDEIERMTELLNAATIFYMAGVHGRHRTTRIDVATEHIQQLVARLKQKMHQNEIAYIGICGGAMLAGKFTEFPHVPFDLLEGTIVCYDSSVGPEHISEMKTDVMKDIVQITSGCAIAVVLTTESRRAVSFSTVKNNAKWKPFAEANTLALQKWLEVKVSTSIAAAIAASAAQPAPAGPGASLAPNAPAALPAPAQQEALAALAKPTRTDSAVKPTSLLKFCCSSSASSVSNVSRAR